LGLVTVSDKAAAPGLWARQTGSDAGYHAWLSAGGQASIRKFNTGGGWNEVTYTNFAWSANTLYCIRFRLQGTSLKMRVWAYGEPEPDTWLLSAVDSTLASGRAGVGSQTSGTRHYQYFSVGTNGDQALLPGASSGGGRIRRANLRMMGLVV
jgi:hypothetical protein